MAELFFSLSALTFVFLSLGPRIFLLNGFAMSAVYAYYRLGQMGQFLDGFFLVVRPQTTHRAADTEVNALNKEPVQCLLVIYAT